MSALILSLLISAHANASPIARISADQSEYTVGQRAIVFLEADHLPEEKREEFFFRVKKSGAEVSVVSLSDHVSVAVAPRFVQAGAESMSMNVYLQEKRASNLLEQGISRFTMRKFSLEKRLAAETNPDLREAIEKEIAEVVKHISFLKEELENERVLLQTTSISVPVNEAHGIVNASGVFSLRANHDPAEYSVGQSASFCALPLTDFTGPGGIRELVFRGSYASYLGTGAKVGSEYRFQLPAFLSGDVGVHDFSVAISIRPKAQSDRLREARVLAAQKRNAYIRDRDASTTEGDKAYYQAKIDDLTLVMAAIPEQLEEILVPVAADALSFQVNP